MVTRTARTEDQPAILSINREGAPGVSPLSSSDVTSLLDQATSFRVVEAQDRVVGYVIAFASHATYDGEEYQWFKGRPGAFLYIDQVAVARDARGGGVASALYADLEAAARRAGFRTITCEVNLRPENPSSLRFHRHRGFLEVGTLHTRDGRFVSLMEKRVAGPA